MSDFDPFVNFEAYEERAIELHGLHGAINYRWQQLSDVILGDMGEGYFFYSPQGTETGFAKMEETMYAGHGKVRVLRAFSVEQTAESNRIQDRTYTVDVSRLVNGWGDITWEQTGRDVLTLIPGTFQQNFSSSFDLQYARERHGNVAPPYAPAPCLREEIFESGVWSQRLWEMNGVLQALDPQTIIPRTDASFICELWTGVPFIEDIL